jgi:hypothetical protein
MLWLYIPHNDYFWGELYIFSAKFFQAIFENNDRSYAFKVHVFKNVEHM